MARLRVRGLVRPRKPMWLDPVLASLRNGFRWGPRPGQDPKFYWYTVKFELLAVYMVLVWALTARVAIKLDLENVSMNNEITRLREEAALHPWLVYSHPNTSYRTNSTGMQWLQNLHAAAGTSEQFALQAVQQRMHAAQKVLAAALAAVNTAARDLALDPDLLQHISAETAQAAAGLHLAKARIEDIMAPLPAPVKEGEGDKQQQTPASGLLWVQKAYIAAGKSWWYNSQVVQAPLQQLTAQYAASVQQLVSEASADQGLPADEAAQVSTVVEAATQDILARTSTILQATEDPAAESQQQPKAQPKAQQKQEGWVWLELAYAASGRSAVFAGISMQHPLQAAVQSCKDSLVMAATAADLAQSPAAAAVFLPVVNAAMFTVTSGVTAAFAPQHEQAQQQKEEALETAVIKAVAYATANTTLASEPTAAVPTAQLQSQLPPLALLPLCSTYPQPVAVCIPAQPIAPAVECPACECADDASAVYLENLGSDDMPVQEAVHTVLAKVADLAAKSGMADWQATARVQAVVKVLESSIEAAPIVMHSLHQHLADQVAAVMPHVSAFIEFNSQRLVGVLTLV